MKFPFKFAQMKINKFNRVLTYVKPYWGSVTMNIVFTILATIFSLFSFSMIVPFLNLLFNPNNLITVKPEFSLSSDVLLETMNYYISAIIISKGQKMALLFICAMLVFIFIINMADTTILYMTKHSGFIFFIFLGYAMALCNTEQTFKVDFPARWLDSLLGKIKKSR